MLRFCSGVNGLNHSSPWSASGQSLSPGHKAYIPTFLPTALTNAWRGLGIFMPRAPPVTADLHLVEWWSERSKSVFGEPSFSPNTHSHTTSVTLPRHSALSLVCMLAHSLTLIHTHIATYTRSFFGFSAPSNESCHLRSWDLLWHTALVWFISYGKWEWKPPLRGENALMPQPDP